MGASHKSPMSLASKGPRVVYALPKPGPLGQTVLPPSPSGRRPRAGASILSKPPSMCGRGRQRAGCQPSMSTMTSFSPNEQPERRYPWVPTPTPIRPTMPIRASARPAHVADLPRRGEPLWLRGDKWQLLGVDAQPLGAVPLSRTSRGTCETGGPDAPTRQAPRPARRRVREQCQERPLCLPRRVRPRRLPQRTSVFGWSCARYSDRWTSGL